MALTFAEHVDLFELHGRAAVNGLGHVSPDDTLPPQEEQAGEVALEHWTTLEIWAWSLENPSSHWSEREDPEEPATHREAVVGIAALTGALATTLRARGPETAVNYFDRPGTTADVARLLAHESIVVAHKAGSAPALSPAVGCDGIDHTISHWSTSDTADTAWQSRTLSIRATDIEGTWQISLPQDGENRIGDFRIASGQGQTPSATVEGPAVELLWWLQGDPIPEDVVMVHGTDADVRALKQTFLQPVPKAPRRWFGLRSG